jgi:hypothetical protein
MVHYFQQQQNNQTWGEVGAARVRSLGHGISWCGSGADNPIKLNKRMKRMEKSRNTRNTKKNSMRATNPVISI